jgi:hypothetical protein
LQPITGGPCVAQRPICGADRIERKARHALAPEKALLFSPATPPARCGYVGAIGFLIANPL